jgi:phosphonatase-like hydrolase
MSIELIVFDIAGTTVNDDDGVNRCVRAALAGYGRIVSASQVNAVMGLPKPEAIALLAEQAGPPGGSQADLAAIYRDFEARSIQFYEHDPSVFEVEGTSRVFGTLKQGGMKVAVDTGFNRAITQVILERLGWLGGGLIDASICSDEAPRGRPHPDMIRSLMARFRITDPSRVGKVGDTPADLLEGNNAGCGLNVGVTSGTHARHELASYPHTHLVNSIRDVPGLLGLAIA